MKKKYSFVVINFFRVTNPYSGASEISYNFFKNIPTEDKKLIQLSEINQKIKNVVTLIANTKLEKIFKIKEICKNTVKFLKNKKNPVIIIEGASWIGYSFFFYILIKNKIKNLKLIYHSHNVEYLLRKKKSSPLIAILTKYFEKYIAKNFDIFTCVSKEDQIKVKKLYNIKTRLLPNGVDIPKKIKKSTKKLNFKYIFFCGSIEYAPNKEALKILINKILPLVSKKNTKIKLVITGSKTIPFENNNLINLGFVPKNKFYEVLNNASIFVNPMKTAFGSQVKMITALMLGKTIIASQKATIGINFSNKSKEVYIANDNNKFADLILKKINSKKNNNYLSKIYKKKYSYKNIVLKFLNNI